MIKKTLKWARDEWGIVARWNEMSATEVLRWLQQWVPFGARTVGYGTISITLGPLTRDRRASLWAMKRWSQSSLDGLNISAEISGEHLVPEGKVMFASNHQSILDILVLGALLPGDIKWAAKRSLLNIPFLGWHLALSGHVPVDRSGGKRSAAETIKRFQHVLEEGKALLIFPEGTRTLDGQVKPFKNGGFYAAVRAHSPVVPVALEGTHDLMHKGANDTGERSRQRHVEVRLGEPLYPRKEGTERERVVDLCERTHAEVTRMHQAMVERRSAL